MGSVPASRPLRSASQLEAHYPRSRHREEWEALAFVRDQIDPRIHRDTVTRCEWEAADLTRIGRLLESDTTRFAGARSLRFLNTPEAAVALGHWYLRLVGEPVNSELANGIFESQYADIVQSELERALRSGVPFTENAVGTLALLEVKRQFINRPPPSDPKAASAWSQEYWALFETMKAKYSPAAHPVH